jgi:hypothetical protein
MESPNLAKGGLDLGGIFLKQYFPPSFTSSGAFPSKSSLPSQPISQNSAALPPPPTSRTNDQEEANHGYTERRTEVLPKLQENCGNESSAGRIFPGRISWHSGQEAPDHMRDRRRRFKRMWNKMVHTGDIGGSGFRERWEERVSCQIRILLLLIPLNPKSEDDPMPK